MPTRPTIIIRPVIILISAVNFLLKGSFLCLLLIYVCARWFFLMLNVFFLNQLKIALLRRKCFI